MRIRDFAEKLTASLLIIPIGIVAFAACGAAAGVGMLLFVWDSSFNPIAHASLATVVRTFPQLIGTALPPAAIGALLLVIFRIRRRPGYRAISLLVGGATVGALLFFGTLEWSREHPGSDRLPQIAARPFVPDRLHLLSTGELYVGAVNDSRLAQVVVVRPDRSPAFTYSAVAEYRPDRQLVSYSGGTIAVDPPNPYFAPVFQPAPFLGGILSDLGALEGALAAAHHASQRDFLAAVGALVLFGMGCILFARMTSWPLLNAFLTLLAYRGFLWGYAELYREPAASFGRQIMARLPMRDVVQLFPSAAVALVGLLLVAIDLIFLNRPVKAPEGEPDE